MTTDVLAATATVLTVNGTLVAPDGTVTDACARLATAVLLLESVTVNPLAGAAEEIRTVPWTGAPPTIVFDASVTADNVGVTGSGGQSMAVLIAAATRRLSIRLENMSVPSSDVTSQRLMWRTDVTSGRSRRRREDRCA